MRRQHLLTFGLAVLTVGCAIAAAWPSGYREAVCAATHYLRAADGAFAEAADGVAAGDSDRLAVAAAGMERESDAALGELGHAPTWAPGAQLVVELRDAAVAFGRAATDFGVGARQGDGPALDRAVALGQDADAALARADQEGGLLKNTIGWRTC